MDERGIKSIFDTMSSSYDMGSYDEFKNALNHPIGALSVYETMASKYDMGGVEKFFDVIGHPEYGEPGMAELLQKPAEMAHSASAELIGNLAVGGISRFGIADYLTPEEKRKIGEKGYEALSTPLIAYTPIKSLSTLVSKDWLDNKGWKGYVATGASAVLQVAEGLVSPLNAALMFIGALPFVGRLATATFTAEMALGMSAEIGQSKEALEYGEYTGDYRPAVDHIIKAIGSGLFILAGAKHAIKSTKMSTLRREYVKNAIVMKDLATEPSLVVSRVRAETEISGLKSRQTEIMLELKDLLGKSKRANKILEELANINKMSQESLEESISLSEKTDPENLSPEELTYGRIQAAKEGLARSKKLIDEYNIYAEYLLEDTRKTGRDNTAELSRVYSAIEQHKGYVALRENEINKWSEQFSTTMRTKLEAARWPIIHKQFIDELTRGLSAEAASRKMREFGFQRRGNPELSKYYRDLELRKVERFFDDRTPKQVRSTIDMMTRMALRSGLPKSEVRAWQERGFKAELDYLNMVDKWRDKANRRSLELAAEAEKQAKLEAAKRSAKERLPSRTSPVLLETVEAKVARNILNFAEKPFPKSVEARYPEYVPPEPNPLIKLSDIYDYKADLLFKSQTDKLFVERGLYETKSSGVIEKGMTLDLIDNKLVVRGDLQKVINSVTDIGETLSKEITIERPIGKGKGKAPTKILSEAETMKMMTEGLKPDDFIPIIEEGAGVGKKTNPYTKTGTLHTALEIVTESGEPYGALLTDKPTFKDSYFEDSRMAIIAATERLKFKTGTTDIEDRRISRKEADLVFRSVVETKRLNEVLSRYSKAMPKGWLKDLTDKVNQLTLPDAEINFFDVDIDVYGMFDVDTNTAYINVRKIKEASLTVVHEAIHGVTARILDRYNDKSYNLPEPELKFAKTMTELYEYAKSKVSSAEKRIYGFDDVHEFISDGLTEPTFVRLLKNTPYRPEVIGASRIRTVWDAFKRALKDLFGIKDESVFDRLLKETNEYMSKRIKASKLAFRGTEYTDLRLAKRVEFNDAVYKDVKPFLEEAYRGYRLEGKKTKHFVDDLVKLLGDEYQPYIVKFTEDLEGHTGTRQIGALSPGELKAMADRAQESSDANRKALELSTKLTLDKVVSIAGRLLWGQSAQIHNKLDMYGQYGKHAIARHSLRKGSTGYAGRLTTMAIHDIETGLSHTEKKILQDYLANKRVVVIDDYLPGRLYRHGLNPDDARAWIETMDSRFGEASARKVIEAGNKAFYYIRRYGLDLLRDERVITDAEYNRIAGYGVYFPIDVINKLSPFDVMQVGNTKISVKDNRVKALDEVGTTGTIEIDYKVLLEDVFRSTQKLLMDNRANRSLFELANNLPGNILVRVPEIKGVTKTGRIIYEPAPEGWEYLSFMVDGIERKVLMEKNAAIEWLNTGDPIKNRMAVRLIEWLSGAKILKASATGYNLVFAARNLVRDFLHIWTTPEGLQNYHWFIPYKMVQMARDYAAVRKDSWRQEGRFMDAAKEGMLMEWLSTSAEGVRFSESTVGKAVAPISKVVNFTEVWSRLALYERALKNNLEKGMSRSDATADAAYQARNYLDFADGGSVVKLFNHFVPYINPAVQAVRGSVRGIYKQPIKAAAMYGQLLAGLVMYHYAVMSLNEDAYNDTRDIDRTINLPIPGAEEYDSVGRKIFYYVKLPLDTGMQVINTVARGIAETIARREDVKWANMNESLKAALPVLPEEFGMPLQKAIAAYQSNYDSFRGKPIWTGRDVATKRLEQKGDEHPISKWIGNNFTSISPRRLEAAISEIITPSNGFVRALGQATYMILEDLSSEDRKAAAADIVRDLAALDRAFLGKTNPSGKEFREIREQELDEGDKRMVVDMEYDLLLDSYFKSNSANTARDIITYIANQSLSEQQRLKLKFKQENALRNVVDKSWWRTTLHKSPEVRAAAFNKRYKAIEIKEKKEEMLKTAMRLPGYHTERFVVELNKIGFKR